MFLASACALWHLGAWGRNSRASCGARLAKGARKSGNPAAQNHLVPACAEADLESRPTAQFMSLALTARTSLTCRPQKESGETGSVHEQRSRSRVLC